MSEGRREGGTKGRNSSREHTRQRDAEQSEPTQPTLPSGHWRGGGGGDEVWSHTHPSTETTSDSRDREDPILADSSENRVRPEADTVPVSICLASCFNRPTWDAVLAKKMDAPLAMVVDAT